MSTTKRLTLLGQVQACRACAHGSTRKQVVFAKGDPLSSLCFVGEAPGAEEDETGLPFVGDAGKLLDKQIAAIAQVRQACTCPSSVRRFVVLMDTPLHGCRTLATR